MGRRKKLINNTNIPQHKVEAIARCLMPDILSYAHYFLGMSKVEIAKSEGVNKSQITRSINKGLIHLEKYLKNIF